ncbi:hypothetical protein BRDCF_p1993 [Bacteroidales bacterium CF]|nr:hypothetical protein BRDCF_p1993 [Bacteroidales bacterium CF]
MAKAHQNNTKTFEELTFAEQAKSINAQIQNLKKAIIAHKKRALVEDKPTNDFVKPIIKMLASL